MNQGDTYRMNSRENVAMSRDDGSDSVPNRSFVQFPSYLLCYAEDDVDNSGFNQMARCSSHEPDAVLELRFILACLGCNVDRFISGAQRSSIHLPERSPNSI